MADVSCTRCRWGYHDARGQWSGCPDCPDEDFPSTSFAEINDARGATAVVLLAGLIGFVIFAVTIWEQIR